MVKKINIDGEEFELGGSGGGVEQLQVKFYIKDVSDTDSRVLVMRTSRPLTENDVVAFCRYGKRHYGAKLAKRHYVSHGWHISEHLSTHPLHDESQMEDKHLSVVEISPNHYRFEVDGNAICLYSQDGGIVLEDLCGISVFADRETDEHIGVGFYSGCRNRGGVRKAAFVGRGNTRVYVRTGIAINGTIYPFRMCATAQVNEDGELSVWFTQIEQY